MLTIFQSILTILINLNEIYSISVNPFVLWHWCFIQGLLPLTNKVLGWKRHTQIKALLSMYQTDNGSYSVLQNITWTHFQNSKPWDFNENNIGTDSETVHWRRTWVPWTFFFHTLSGHDFKPQCVLLVFAKLWSERKLMYKKRVRIGFQSTFLGWGPFLLQFH